MSEPSHVSKCIENAKQFKKAGDAFFKDKNYKEANKSYSKIFLYIRGLKAPETTGLLDPAISDKMLPKVTSTESNELGNLEIAANANLALCHWKLENYNEVIKYATEVLKLDPAHSKTLYRRGDSHLHLNNVDQARADFEAALGCSGNDAEKAQVRKGLAKVEQKEKLLNDRMVKSLAGMFERGSLSN